MVAQLDVEPSSLEDLRKRVAAFIDGTDDLTGLELYYLLEAATPLLEFHTVVRSGPRNRTRSGLQQSYGDHNRLLLLGLDRLVDGDLDWYRDRLERQGAVGDDRLEACFAAVRFLQLDRPALAALWLGGALHDCGMLSGHHPGVDVEDGVVIAADVLEALCPPELVPLANFGVRNHDYIKDVFRGEVPAAFLDDQIRALPEHLQPAALPVLGMIQVAGAASLGEGRLSAFRVSLCERCFDGTALADRSARTRLARLLDNGEETAELPPTDEADAALADLSADDRQRLERFLWAVPIQRWHKTWDEAGAAAQKVPVLVTLSRLWDGSGTHHVVLEEGIDFPGGPSWDPPVDREHLANGTTALIVG